MRYKEVIVMPMSLRIPIQKESMIEKAAIKEKKTKTAFVIEAIDEKLGLVKNRESALRDFAGWLSSIEAEELRLATDVFETIQEGDWK
jgi:predicted DNA-binding protein